MLAHTLRNGLPPGKRPSSSEVWLLCSASVGRAPSPADLFTNGAREPPQAPRALRRLALEDMSRPALPSSFNCGMKSQQAKAPSAWRTEKHSLGAR